MHDRETRYARFYCLLELTSITRSNSQSTFQKINNLFDDEDIDLVIFDNKLEFPTTKINIFVLEIMRIVTNFLKPYKLCKVCK